MCANACRRQHRPECPECLQEYIDDLAWMRDFEKLCSSNPELAPGHQWATEAEWRAHEA